MLRFLGREKEARNMAPEASADQSDFFPVSRDWPPLARRNLHLVTLSMDRVQPLFFPYFQFLKIPRSCRVLQGSEPALAGGVRPGTSALARAYRVMRREMGPLVRVLVQDGGCSIANTAGQLSYTIESRVWVEKN